MVGDSRVMGGQGSLWREGPSGRSVWGQGEGGARSFFHSDLPLTHLKRLSWHHPGGSDLLRCGGFYTASDPNKEDIR